MTAKHCAYCGDPIHGEALPVGDDTDSGVHPPAYWHKTPAECGPPQSPLPGPDDSVTVPPRFIPLGRDGRP